MDEIHEEIWMMEGDDEQDRDDDVMMLVDEDGDGPRYNAMMDNVGGYPDDFSEFLQFLMEE
jgi:hypothetical protein